MTESFSRTRNFGRTKQNLIKFELVRVWNKNKKI